jgi:patatin-like phospholipase/acyl hydrolase
MEKFRILSLDGGGIRGIITAVILIEIERKIKQKTGQTLQDYFHLIAGTSTGSILAAGIASGYTADKLLKFYTELGKTIFPENKRKPLLFQDVGDIVNHWSRIGKEGFDHSQYENAPLVKALKDKFGEKTELSGLSKNLVLITTYDASNRRPVLIRNWHKEWDYVPVWEACVSSASAPTFFPPYELKLPDPDATGKEKKLNLIDGGVFANNPSTCALTQALKLSDDPNDNQIVEDHHFPMPPTGRENFFSSVSVLSVGTGDYTRPIPYEQSKKWGTLQWVAPLIDVMFDGSNIMNDKLVECLIGNSKSYLRLQPSQKC